MHATLINTLAIGLGSSWVAGINLYATVAVLGMLGRWGGLELPGELQVLTHGGVIATALALYSVEFFADKIPYLDSTWDVIHTFIRIPAGATLAAEAFGDYDPAIKTIALLIGGGLALGSHGTKVATRATINLSPEPVTNIVASVTEDVFTVGYVFAIYFFPLLALAILAVGLIILALVLPRLWRFARNMLSRFRRKPASEGAGETSVETTIAISETLPHG